MNGDFYKCFQIDTLSVFFTNSARHKTNANYENLVFD